MELLVLESSWDSQGLNDVSVWPFLKEFANVSGVLAYYKTFSDLKSLRHWIDVFDQSSPNKKKVLYIASHGSDSRIHGLNKAINLSTLIQLLDGCESISHVLFGCCSLGGKDNLEQVVRNANSITFASGYEKAVDWIDSTLFDLFVLRMIFDRDSRALHTRLYSLMDSKSKGLADELEFKFAYKYRNQVHGSIRLPDDLDD